MTKPKERSQPTPWELFKADPQSITAICEHIVSGESLADFAKKREFPYVTLLDWINGEKTRSEHYARAREARADLVFEQLDDVSRDAVAAENAVTVAGLRLKADNIKWKLARMSPKKYGDKLALGGADDLPPIQSQSDLRGLSDDELNTVKKLLVKAKTAIDADAA